MRAALQLRPRRISVACCPRQAPTCAGARNPPSELAVGEAAHFFIVSGDASFEKPSGSKKPSGAQSPTMPSIFIEMAGAALRTAEPIGAAKPELQTEDKRRVLSAQAMQERARCRGSALSSERFGYWHGSVCRGCDELQPHLLRTARESAITAVLCARGSIRAGGQAVERQARSVLGEGNLVLISGSKAINESPTQRLDDGPGDVLGARCGESRSPVLSPGSKETWNSNGAHVEDRSCRVSSLKLDISAEEIWLARGGVKQSSVAHSTAQPHAHICRPHVHAHVHIWVGA